MIRTTVRKKAIEERVAFADIVNQALHSYLGKPRMKKPGKYSFKVYSSNSEIAC